MGNENAQCVCDGRESYDRGERSEEGADHAFPGEAVSAIIKSKSACLTLVLMHAIPAALTFDPDTSQQIDKGTHVCRNNRADQFHSSNLLPNLILLVITFQEGSWTINKENGSSKGKPFPGIVDQNIINMFLGESPHPHFRHRVQQDV